MLAQRRQAVGDGEAAMIVIAGALVGAVLGAVLARKRGGNRLDMLQYAAGFAILLAVAGLFLTILIERSL